MLELLKNEYLFSAIAPRSTQGQIELMLNWVFEIELFDHLTIATNDRLIELSVIHSNNWNLLNSVEKIAILVCKQISSFSFKNEITDKLIPYILCISI